ncbi:hypothetical protein IQ251_13390 [Saccharopolyspora sp. HNM0983]|uniref:DUF7144 domain-containing protein n=1 Tax=Saccharopolyspora montiporae TaxID=2781240 RepID=A0A929FY69_9PSEU|nr:hypothetical protein [Saccharopolyspora sp. HNM0983]MBE9375441.1 hypothetical protein [Saccharopolyspora sp. HNM0983]
MTSAQGPNPDDTPRSQQGSQPQEGTGAQHTPGDQQTGDQQTGDQQSAARRSAAQPAGQQATAEQPSGAGGSGAGGSESAAPRSPGGNKHWAVTAAGDTREPAETDTLSGWLTFGGSLILLIGVFNIISGLTAFFRVDYFVAAPGELLVLDYASWGWIFLGLGVLQVAVGMGALFGQTWARATGVVLAGLAAIGHLAFLGAFPLWSLVVIAMCVVVMYALIAPSRGSVGT